MIIAVDEDLFEALLYVLAWVVLALVLCLLSVALGVTPGDVAHWALDS